MESPEPAQFEHSVESESPFDAEPTGEAHPSELDAVTSAINEAESTLGDVEAALERLESGEYGTCEVCSAAIEPAILERSPVARRCSAHAA